MKTDQRKLKGEETKNKILDVAMLLISEGGIKSVSANKIAERAGISKSSIFHHFASIEDIPYTLLSNLCEMMTGQVRIGEVTDLKSFFDVIGKSIFEIGDEELVYYRALYTFYNEAVYSGNYQEQLIQIKSDFMLFLQESIQVIENIDISMALAELISMDMDGFGLHYLMEENREKYKVLWKLKTDVYIEYINSRK